jgi:hypothetical protein
MQLETTDDKFLISIDKNLLHKDFVMQLIEKLRLEHLSQKVNFSDNIESEGENIKREWWDKNKERLV